MKKSLIAFMGLAFCASASAAIEGGSISSYIANTVSSKASSWMEQPVAAAGTGTPGISGQGLSGMMGASSGNDCEDVQTLVAQSNQRSLEMMMPKDVLSANNGQSRLCFAP